MLSIDQARAAPNNSICALLRFGRSQIAILCGSYTIRLPSPSKLYIAGMILAASIKRRRVDRKHPSACIEGMRARSSPAFASIVWPGQFGPGDQNEREQVML